MDSAHTAHNQLEKDHPWKALDFEFWVEFRGIFKETKAWQNAESHSILDIWMKNQGKGWIPWGRDLVRMTYSIWVDLSENSPYWLKYSRSLLSKSFPWYHISRWISFSIYCI